MRARASVCVRVLLRRNLGHQSETEGITAPAINPLVPRRRQVLMGVCFLAVFFAAYRGWFRLAYACQLLCGRCACPLVRPGL